MQNQIEAAVGLYSSGQFKMALTKVKGLVIEYPNEAILFNLSGACYSALSDFENAAKSYREALSINQNYVEVHNSLGVCLQNIGNLEGAVSSYMNAIALSPNFAEAHNNLGNTYKELKQLESAIDCYKKSIAIKPNFAYPYYNLGLIFHNQNELLKAIQNYEKAIQINPNYFEAHNNLGGALQYFGKMNLAVDSYKRAIEIKPNFVDAYINLGIILTEIGRLSEAEISLKQAISISPKSAKALNHIGNTYKDLGRLNDAELNYRKAIQLEPNYANAYNNLGIILYASGNIDSSIESLEKAHLISSESSLLLSVIRSKKLQQKSDSKETKILSASDRLANNPLILNRKVENELIDTLYEIKAIELDEVRDPGYGNAKGSDIRNSLFNDERPIIKSVEKDLIKMIKDAIKTDIFIDESWFVILGAGGGLNSHNHLTYLDKDPTLNLAAQKYSLVYYISPGDQDCTEPGYLKLYDPSEDVLPTRGMVLIFPADRPHSVIYNGTKDRVIIGINFYSL